MNEIILGARAHIDGYLLFWIFLGILTYTVAMYSLSKYNVTDYRDYDSYTNLMWKITRSNFKSTMLKRFDRHYSFTELLDWVDEQIEWVPENETMKERYFYPSEILDAGIGRCGEHTNLYVAVCLAQGYETRIVRSFKTDDHSWAEVKLNGEWLHVEVVDKYWNDPYRRFDNGKNITHVIAYNPYSWENVTYRYVRER